MKNKKNTTAKVVAFIALLAIIIWIIGTGALVIVNSFIWGWNVEITEEQLQDFIDSYSWTTLEADGVTVTSGETLLDNPTWDTPAWDISPKLEATVEIENNVDAQTDSPDIIETLNPES